MAVLDHLILLRCGEATFNIYLTTCPVLQINNMSRTELIAISAHHITTPCDIEETLKLNDLKSGKCAGLDYIKAEHLKNASNVLNVLLSTAVYFARLRWSMDIL